MKTIRQFLVLLLLLVMAVPVTVSAQKKKAVGAPKQKVERVVTAEGLIRALKSNTRIIIPEGTEILLTPALENDALCDLLHIVKIDTYADDFSSFKQRPTLGWADHFDGRELIVAGMRNITIEGEGEGARLIVTPRYAYVLRFVACTGIKVNNLTLGHTDEGYCQGGVLSFHQCDNVNIDHCDMFGCGTEGIEAVNTTNLACENSIIRECSYFIMTVKGCTGVQFTGCYFFLNKEFTLVNVNGSKNVVFTRCLFEENKGTLFRVNDFKVVLEDCVVNHPEDSRGDTQMLTLKTTDWIAP